MTGWIDSHAHLDDEAFAQDVPEVLTRAREAGLAQVITVASDLASTRRCLKLAAEHPWLFATAGVHPHEAGAAAPGDLDRLAELGADPKVVAVGETGLDYHYDLSPREDQRQWMAQCVALALELDKPLVVHVREAFEDVVAILSAEGGSGLRGVIHCFTGDTPQARRYLDMGLYLSFSGIITFSKAEAIREVARWAPLDRILVETDSPYLAPVPHRGRRNEPAYVVRTAEALAKLRGLPLEELADATTRNTRTLFALPEP